MSQETRCDIGDLVKVFGALAPDSDSARENIARLLKIPWTSAQRTADLPDKKEEPPPPAAKLPADQHKVVDPPRKSRPAPPQPSGKPLHTTLSPIRSVPREGPQWTRHVRPWQPPPSQAAPPAPEPLFEPVHTRGILAASVSTMLERGELDLEFVISKTARGEAMSSVPRKMIPSLCRGVQLLVDLGSGMMPYRHDVEEIQRAIRDLVGDDALQLLTFAGSPTRGVEPVCAADKVKNLNARDYLPRFVPAPGTRVICISDLGIGAGADVDVPASRLEWQMFARWIAEVDCPLTVLTPYLPARRRQLARVLHMVHWDRRTTAAKVARLLRDKPR